MAGLAWALVATLGAVTLQACGRSDVANDPNTQRLWTDDFYIRVTPNPAPPRALEQIEYTVVVQDKKTVATTALKSGAEIGVAGARNCSATAARLIVIK